MNLFLTFFVVNQFLRKWTNSSSFRRCSPPRRLSSLARSAPPRVPLASCRLSSLARRRPPSPSTIFVAPALVPGLSASALTCRQRPLACRSHCTGSRPLPVSVRPRLPSLLSSPPPPTAVDAPDRPSLSRRRASFRCFVCVVSSR